MNHTFTFPFEAYMTVLEINKVKVNLGKSIVFIDNISPRGLQFHSNIKFPNNQRILLGFDTYILNVPINLCGQLIWSKEENEGNEYYEYEIEFSIHEAVQEIHLKYNSDQVVH